MLAAGPGDFSFVAAGVGAVSISPFPLLPLLPASPVLCCLSHFLLLRRWFPHCRAEFRVLFIVEEGDVSEHLELVHHVAPVDVQAVEVVNESRDVLRHRRQF